MVSKTIELDEKYKERAEAELDFDGIRDDPRFQELVFAIADKFLVAKLTIPLPSTGQR
ncbi:MAG: TPR end-of-group domain-containing protein [Prochlorotrichaceae cyanobacterium]